MLSTTSILSLDQGKLLKAPKSDEEYFARFAPAKPRLPRLVKPWPRLSLVWLLRPLLQHR
jgi:hypothetical protein